MNEREQFYSQISQKITKVIQRIETMTEPEVLSALHAIQARRRSEAQTLDFLNSVSIAPAEDSEGTMNELRSQLNARKHSGESPSAASNYIENALKRRLATLRNEGA